MTNLHKAVLALAISLASASLALAQGTYTQIDYPGAYSTRVLGIDSAGDMVGFYETSANGLTQGFLMTSDGAFVTVDTSEMNTALTGINDKGLVVGYGLSFSAHPKGFLYSIATQQLKGINYPGAGGTVPLSINNSGVVVGYYTTAPRLQFGFQLSGSAYTSIEAPGDLLTEAVGVSGSGKIIGLAGAAVPFLYHDGVLKKIRSPELPVSSIAEGISPAGTAIAGYYPSGTGEAAFVLQNGTLTTLQFPGSSNTYGQAINDSGQVAGWFLSAGDVFHGFVWTPPADAARK
jgi:uncharacterized membrane protein